MISAVSGKAFTIYADDFDPGRVGQVGFRVEDMQGNVVIARTVDQVYEPEPGGYSRSFLAPVYTDVVQLLAIVDDPDQDLVGRDVIQVYPVGQEPVIHAADGYPSTASLVARSKVEELTDLEADEQDALRDMAITAIEEHCGQRFVPEVLTLKVNGNGGQTVALPRRLAVLDTLAAAGTVLGAANAEITDTHDTLQLADTGRVGWLQRAEADAFGWGAPSFPLGVGNITVTGTWGWLADEFPRAVRDAILIDMEDQAIADASELASTVRGFRRLGLREARQGNLSFSMRGSAGLGEKAIGLLRAYVWTPAGVVV